MSTRRATRGVSPLSRVVHPSPLSRGVRATMPPVERQKSKGGKDAGKAVQIGSLLAVIGDEDTVTGMLLAGIGNVDARRTSNFLVVDAKTTPGQVEEAFNRFTSRTDVAILLINQYIAGMIRDTIDNFVSAYSPNFSHEARRVARARGRRATRARRPVRAPSFAPALSSRSASHPPILSSPPAHLPLTPRTLPMVHRVCRRLNRPPSSRSRARSSRTMRTRTPSTAAPSCCSASATRPQHTEG